jgi:phenylacetate-CoA ligase
MNRRPDGDAPARIRMLRWAWDVWRAGQGPPSGIGRRQRARVRDLLAFARTRSPFYRRLCQALPAGTEELRAIPPVTRRQLMASFDDVVTDPAVTRAGVEAFVSDRGVDARPYLGRYHVWTSSGGTAEPRIFVHDDGALAIYRAVSLMRGWLPWMTPRRLSAILRSGDRVACVIGTGGRFPSIELLKHQQRHRPWPFNRFRVFSAQLPIPQLVDGLNEFRPAELIGYPSMLASLAHEQMAGRLTIRPALIGSGGEWLGPDNRRLIETAFGCSLRENYGAAEFPQAIWDCRHGRLHVSADWLILEPVDERYEPVPPGRESHTVLVTNLANRVMPIIRYDVGDSVMEYADRCRCGSPLPAIQVAGRQDDVLVMRGPTGEPVRLIPITIGMAIQRTPGLRRFQIIQTGETRLSLRLEIDPDASVPLVWEKAIGRLREYLAARSLTEVQIDPSPDPPGVDPRNGKMRRIWSQLQEPPRTSLGRDGGHRQP